MTEQDRQAQIKRLHTKLDTFLSTIHDLSDQGGLVSPTGDEWRALGSLFAGVLDLKFRPDCDGWLPVSFHFNDVARHRRPYFKSMPRGLLKTLDEWNAALEIALHNVGIAIGEYQQVVREKPEEKE